MTLRNIAAATIAALALVACDDDDDDNNTKPITPDTPATPEACKAMKCVYQTEGDFKGSFVAKNEKGEPIAVWDAKGNQTHKLGKDGKLHKIEKPDDGKKPGTTGEFDLSGEGVNEPIANETVHGGGIYMRGTKSKQDLKEAPQADLSPIGVFGLDKDWDQSLSNIVIAKTLDAKGNVTSVIGAEDVSFSGADSNATKNDHTTVFAGAPNPSVNGVDTTGANLVKEGLPTIDLTVKEPDTNKAYQANGSLLYADTDGIWPNQEESKAGAWDGSKPVRLYGHNAWFKGDSTAGNIFRIAHYDKVINQTALKKASTFGIDKTQELPTDIAFDTLKYVQFGRVTSDVSNLTNADSAYHVDGLQFAARATSASDRIVAGGDQSGTDFYFARGNNCLLYTSLKALPSNLIAYHGNALVFGLDNSFHGGKTAAVGAPSKSLPHSFGKAKVADGVQTLLGGRGNFVYAQLDPSKGNVEGSIYNVWLVGTYKPENVTASTKKYYELDANGEFKGGPSPFDAAKHLKDVFPVKDDLVQFEGKVGGNSIKGDAMNYAGQKGKFSGALFGKQADEISGVITSNTEEYGKPDASPHWGAVFGAKVLKTETGVALPAMGEHYTSWLHEKNKK